MRLFVRSVTASLATVSVLSASLHPQPVKPITLAPESARLGAEFIKMTSVRELADGRVIVSDHGDGKIFLADFTANTATVLGRQGRGPGEWMDIGTVYSIGGDSTIMNDMAMRRWLLFDGAKVANIVPPDHPAVKATGELIFGADASGHILAKKSPLLRNEDTEFSRKDSIAVVLINRSSGRGDTVAKVRIKPQVVSREMDNKGDVHRVSSRPTEANAQEEGAVLAPDGWMAIVRLEPLRIDWRSPSGQWTKGTALPLKPDVVDARERRAIQKRYEQNLAAFKAGKQLRPSPPIIPEKYNVWNSSRGLFITPDGRVVLRRTSTTAMPAHRYVVVNRRGTIDGQFTLGEKEDIIGFGAKHIYIGSLDDNDIQTLRRHPWP